MTKVNVDNLKVLFDNYVRNRQFSKVSAGTITSVNPLKVKLVDNIELPEELVTITWADELTEASLNQKIFLIRQDEGGHYFALPKFTPEQLYRLNNDSSASNVNNGYGNIGEVTSSNAWLNEIQMEDNAKYIWTWLKDNGWSEQAAAGFLGNTRIESGHNPGIYENLDHGNMQRGFGLVQWTPAKIFHDWAKQSGQKVDSIDAQLSAVNGDVLKHWIPTSDYQLSYETFKKSTMNPYHLANAFLLNFERPANARGQLTYMNTGNVVNAPVTIIGDSLLNGVTISSYFKNAVLDAANSRFLVNSNDPSGAGDGIETIRRLATQDRLYKTVVLALGTNGGFTSQQLDNAISTAKERGAKTVFLVDTNSNVSHRNSVEQLMKAKANGSDVIHVDWRKHSDEVGRSTIYGSDDIHMKAPDKYVEYIAQVVANSTGSEITNPTKRGEWAEYYYSKFKGMVYRPAKGGLTQPKASKYDSSKSTRATAVSTIGWNLAEVNRFKMHAADPPHVNGTYIDNFLKSYYSDSPLIGQGETIKRWSDYYGISVGAALGVWAKETTFGRNHPGRDGDFNYGCMIWETTPQYPKVFYGDRNWAKYPSKNVGIGEWFKYVRHKYIEPGAPFYSNNYAEFLNRYSPPFENNQASFKNIMWGILRSFGYDTSDTVTKTNHSKSTDDVQQIDINNLALPGDYQADARLDKLVEWFESRVGKVRYSMASRKGPNSYDCSSALFSAMIYAGFLPAGTSLGTTETLFGYEGSRLIRINRNQIRRGDIFVSGVPGSSSGSAGHTGVIYDSNRIIHCTYSRNGIAITPISGFTGSPVRYYRIAGTESSGSSSGSSSATSARTRKLEEAIRIATAQVGKRYILGAVGPNAFDCSGLVYYAYRQAGFSINHRCTTATMNANRSPFKTIGRSELQRGDLIMYSGHVGIYLGPTLSSPKSLVHAAAPGLGVIYQAANSMSIAGYRRVVG